jgi:hypothetical protein
VEKKTPKSRTEANSRLPYRIATCSTPLAEANVSEHDSDHEGGETHVLNERE